MTCGIYGIRNKLNNKIYIGQSIDINGHQNPFYGKKHKIESKLKMSQ